MEHVALRIVNLDGGRQRFLSLSSNVSSFFYMTAFFTPFFNIPPPSLRRKDSLLGWLGCFRYLRNQHKRWRSLLPGIYCGTF